MQALPWSIALVAGLSLIAVAWSLARSYNLKIEKLKRDHRESLVVQETSHKDHTWRLKREFEKERQRIHLALVADLLPGFDALSKARHTAQNTEETSAQLREGLHLVERELHKALHEHQITLLAPLPGEPFDPHIHESIGFLADATLPTGTIANTLRPGWQHPSKVLRPAMVQLASMPAITAIATSEGEDDDENEDMDGPGLTEEG